MKPYPQDRGASPYGQLYIYYINGRIQTDTVSHLPAFIGDWEEEGDTFLFFSEPADPLVENLIRHQKGTVLQDRFQMSYEQWQGEHVSAYTVGRLYVKPPWDASAAPDEKICLLMDPGVVFGNGRHPTTRDCLIAIQQAFAAETVSSVIDLGTGTGLLAMAAAGLGAGRVVAVDLNRLATQTARRNTCLNNMTDRILVVQGDAKNFMDVTCDLMVSNIHYAVMRPMIEMPGFRTHKQFVLSGLLRSQAMEIEVKLKQRAARIIHRWDQDGTWFTYWGRNP